MPKPAAGEVLVRFNRTLSTGERAQVEGRAIIVDKLRPLPVEAIVRGYDKRTERDFSRPGNFFSNYEPLTKEAAQAVVEDAIGFDAFTEPVRAIFEQFLEAGRPDYLVSPAHPRLVDGKPSKNPRYLQERLDLEDPRALPVEQVDEPSLSMTLGINTSPLAGQEGSRLTASQVKDWWDLRVITRVNGVAKQDSNTRHMYFKIPRIIAELSAGLTLEPGEPRQFGAVTVTPFPVVHGDSGGPFFAYRVEAEGRSVAYSGDTQWTDALVQAGRDADLFISECYTYDRPTKNHLNFKQLETHLPEINPKRVVLTHMGEEMLRKLDAVPHLAAYDGLIVEL